MVETDQLDFYFEVDGIFDIIGKGIVATGIVQGNCISIGDRVIICSRLFEDKKTNVIGIEKFTKNVKKACPSEYVGLLLSDLKKSDIHKKDIIRKHQESQIHE